MSRDSDVKASVIASLYEPCRIGGNTTVFHMTYIKRTLLWPQIGAGIDCPNPLGRSG